MRKEAIRSYIYWLPEEFVVASLKHTARQLIPVMHIELAQNVARRKRHFVYLKRVPRSHNHTATCSLCRVFECINDLLQLVNTLFRRAASLLVIRRIEMSPLKPVPGTNQAFSII